MSKIEKDDYHMSEEEFRKDIEEAAKANEKSWLIPIHREMTRTQEERVTRCIL